MMLTECGSMLRGEQEGVPIPETLLQTETWEKSAEKYPAVKTSHCCGRNYLLIMFLQKQLFCLQNTASIFTNFFSFL